MKHSNFPQILSILLFLTALTVVLITLKITGEINWDWIMVFSPFWMSMLVALLLVILGLIIAGVSKLFKR